MHVFWDNGFFVITELIPRKLENLYEVHYESLLEQIASLNSI